MRGLPSFVRTLRVGALQRRFQAISVSDAVCSAAIPLFRFRRRLLRLCLITPNEEAYLSKEVIHKRAEPEAQKSISYGSNDKKLFAAVKKLLSDAEWETLCDSRVGVFCKFHDLDFEWSSKFSLHEFEHLTGLNCDYVEDIDDPKCKVTLEMRAFWEKLGVGVELGPSQVEIIRACEWATDWPSEDKLRLGYLAIYTGFIAARKNTSHTPVNLARLVMDEEEFENYPWGRVAFKNLIEAVKEAELWKSGYVLDGFVEALQVWAYRFMPEFGAGCGAPIRNAPDIPLLSYKGVQGLRNIELTILKQVNFDHCIMVERDFVYPKWDEDKEDPRVDELINALYGDLGRWRWKPADWNPQGVLVKNPIPRGVCEEEKSL
ncbi:unnamed protein product [Microthlaspi erraticum]|uniref:DUF1985 domain-containing protein n=1 Tax=Microthlaspi erraticum TaxID=1685480 RepID=A0A6D2JD97_9BRAS|nr:unnamed protein product [Microthlaspi erraticum]